MHMDLHSLPLEQLVERIRTAPREEMSGYCEELVTRFEPLIRRAWRNIGSDVEVEYEDFLQDVLVRLVGSLPQLKDVRAFPGFFRRIVFSIAIDTRRRQRRLPATDSRNLEEIASSVDRSLLTGLFVRSYIEELPGREREIMALAFVEGLSDREISRITGITEGAVRTCKSRAIKRLRGIAVRKAEGLTQDKKR